MQEIYRGDLVKQQWDEHLKSLRGGLTTKKFTKLKEYLKKDDKIGITKRCITPEQFEELCEDIYKERNIDFVKLNLNPEEIIELRIHPDNLRFWSISDEDKEYLAREYYMRVIFDYLRENNLPVERLGFLRKDLFTEEFFEGFFLAVDILNQNT